MFLFQPSTSQATDPFTRKDRIQLTTTIPHHREVNGFLPTKMDLTVHSEPLTPTSSVSTPVAGNEIVTSNEGTISNQVEPVVPVPTGEHSRFINDSPSNVEVFDSAASVGNDASVAEVAAPATVASCKPSTGPKACPQSKANSKTLNKPVKRVHSTSSASKGSSAAPAKKRAKSTPSQPAGKGAASAQQPTAKKAATPNNEFMFVHVTRGLADDKSDCYIGTSPPRFLSSISAAQKAPSSTPTRAR